MRTDNLNSPPGISVLIAAHNEAATIEACLRSVLACSVPDGFEMVVVDDGSTDGTRAVVENLAGEDARVRLVPLAWGGKGRALNAAARYARGAVYLVTDADCRVPASWLTGMVSELERTDVVYGTCRLWDGPADGGWWPRVLESKWRVKWGPGAPDILAPVGASMGCRRAIWEDIGGFVESGSGADSDFAERAIERGWRVTNSLADHARVLTRAPGTYRSFLRQMLRWRNWRGWRNLLSGRWPGWRRAMALAYASGVSLVFVVWTVWCLVTGNWAGLGLGVLAVVGVDLVAYRRPLSRLAGHPETRIWALRFPVWVLCMLPVRLLEIPYLLVRVVRGDDSMWRSER
ncbi:MAG: glycosyltransferase [Dehalococcoidia bacterium]|jgi:glycosyltransferase involved in cell wall biosynthesis|nr:glycosyltransferase [Dehalococcoidia bacterium]